MQNERVLLRGSGKTGTHISRIIEPADWYRIREQLDPNVGYRTIFDGLINTGARVVEFWYIVANPECYHPSIRAIDLPTKGACKKAHCKQTNRTIMLTKNGCKVMDHIYAMELGYRDPTSMQEALKRAAKKAGFSDLTGFNSKAPRKWLVSWLFDCKKDLGIDTTDICQSMGHDVNTLLASYAGCKFTETGHADMVKFLEGWGK